MSDYVRSASGLLVPARIAGTGREQRPRAIDLFAGCGGMSHGLIQAGYEVLAGVDNAPDAAHTYMLNLGAYPCRFVFVADEDRRALEQALSRSFRGKKDDLVTVQTAGSAWRSHHPEFPGVGTFFLGDVRQLKGSDILGVLGLEPGELDLITGGPPCQGYSIAGQRNVLDPRNSLVFEFARLVCEIRPKAMIMENVPGMRTMVTPDGVPVIDALARIFEDGGFGGYDTFLRSFKAQAGTVGLLRGRKEERKDARKKKAKRHKQEPDGRQLDLFEDPRAR